MPGIGLYGSFRGSARAECVSGFIFPVVEFAGIPELHQWEVVGFR